MWVKLEVIMYNEMICNSYDANTYGEYIIPYYADLKGNTVKKTPITNPYDFDDYVEWKGNYRQFDPAVYSVRLYQWDTAKYKKCYEQVFKNNGQRFDSKNVSGIRKFLSMYFDKEIELTAIMQGCNHISGFPYWIFFYRELQS